LTGSYSAAIVLRWHKRGFLADCITKYGFDIFITALVGFPMVVSEGLVDGMDIELVDELLVSVGIWSCRGHDAFELKSLLWVWRCVEMADGCG
jgi:hypothetical protein